MLQAKASNAASRHAGYRAQHVVVPKHSFVPQAADQIRLVLESVQLAEGASRQKGLGQQTQQRQATNSTNSVIELPRISSSTSTT